MSKFHDAAISRVCRRGPITSGAQAQTSAIQIAFGTQRVGANAARGHLRIVYMNLFADRCSDGGCLRGAGINRLPADNSDCPVRRSKAEAGQPNKNQVRCMFTFMALGRAKGGNKRRAFHK
ncbi:hypothetical protein [Pseudomonas turukhanskensis]|uniref:Uncharacterized protein n=1 Tax=Pseudomonas turukhanskensis TaxID=1806536 RepID=A0A9W6K625_9PSED|nr:hypothetical protein [Pseudomonas turukhanskensis]GLK90210.1 hypothetical protein GCM10017655_32720 [Pseudomonas turukhanskensis]